MIVEREHGDGLIELPGVHERIFQAHVGDGDSTVHAATPGFGIFDERLQRVRLKKNVDLGIPLYPQLQSKRATLLSIEALRTAGHHQHAIASRSAHERTPVFDVGED